MAARRRFRIPPSARQRLGTGAFNLVSLALAAALVLLIVYPLVAMTIRQLVPGGRVDFEAMGRVLTDPDFHTAARNTAVILVVAGACALLIGSTFAWLNERTDARVEGLVTTLPLIPLVLPPIALSIGWMFIAEETAGTVNVALRGLLGLVGIDLERGPLSIVSWYGVVFLYTIWFVPFVYVIVANALRNMDPAIEEASRVFGAGPLRTLVRASLPAVRPALAAAGFLVLLMGVAQFSIGRTIGAAARIDVLTVYLVRLFREFPADVAAAVFVGLLVFGVVLMAWYVQSWLSHRYGHSTIGGKGQAMTIVRLGHWRWIARSAMVLYIFLASVLPFLSLLAVALQPYWSASFSFDKITFDNFTELFTNDYHRRALLNSFRLGLVGATIGMLVAAILVSYTRFGRSRLHGLVDGAARSPGAISNIVIAIAVLVALGGRPFRLGGTIAILLIVYVVMNMPQAWITSSAAMDQVGKELLDASSISGASRARTFAFVNLPLMAGGLGAGWAMLFVVMAGDLTASAILAGVKNPVVGFVILDIWDSGTFSQLAAIGVIMATISAIVITLVMKFTGRQRIRTGPIT